MFNSKVFLSEVEGHGAGCGCAACSDTDCQGEDGPSFAFAPAAGYMKASSGTHDVDHDHHDDDQNVDALMNGSMWLTSSLTFSFPDSASDYSYRGYENVRDGFAPVTVAMAEAVREILVGYENVSALRFTELDGDADKDADLAFARSNVPSTAFTYLPFNGSEGGDGWYNMTSFNSPVAGNYAWSTIIHEIGHGIGLKHGHEDDGNGAMEYDYDSNEYSLMTYRSYVGSAGQYYTNGASSGAQTLMMFDIAAVQELYGANFNSNAGNDVYKFSPGTGRMSVNGRAQEVTAGDEIFRTIWDGNGNDTYDFSNYKTRLSIDLDPGSYSDLDVGGNAQRAYLGGGVYARGHVFNALQYNGDARSLIENAIGGSAADTLNGNRADNRLEGRGGNDRLIGGAGDDTLTGGTGADAFIFSGSQMRGDADLISDLDFSEGDSISISGFGSTIKIDSFADLVALDRSSSLDVAKAGGSTVISLQGDASSKITLSSVDWNAAMSRAAGPEGEVHKGGARADRLVGGTGDDTLKGVGGNDMLKGGAGSDRIVGGAGADRVIGNKGNDKLVGGAGNDRLAGGKDADKLLGGGGHDALFGQHGNDRLFGGVGADKLHGGGGNDILKGQIGRDLLNGQAGDDRLFGGAGADRFLFQRNSGHDTILDFQNGIDRIVIQNGANRFSQLDISRDGHDTEIHFGNTTITLEDVGIRQIDAHDFIF